MKYPRLLFFAVFILGLALRLVNLEQRPMHGDEAIHAIKFGALLEEGAYTYDPHEYHGPTLNYFTLLPAWLTFSKNLAAVDESVLRIVPVFFGVVLILLLLPFAKSAGWPFTLTAALFTAVSPTMIFYSRYYIQEMLLVCFAFGLIVSGFRYLQTSKRFWAASGGLFLGLMHATKETFVILIAAMIFAFVFESFFRRGDNSGMRFFFRLDRRRLTKHLLFGVGIAALISMLFFSSFFSNPNGVPDSVLTYKTYLDRAAENTFHLHPWHYYLKILIFFQIADAPFFSDVFFVVLALAGGVFAFKRSEIQNLARALMRFLTIYTAALFMLFSAIPYKTPWNMLPFYQTMLILAAFGAVSIWKLLRKRILEKKKPKALWKMARPGFIVAFLLGFGHIVWQAHYWNFKAYASPANPHVYAHPTNDVFAMTNTIKAFAAASGEGKNLYLEFIRENHDYWPFPWYLRDYPNIGWRNQIDFDAPSAPIIVISPKLEGDLITKLYERTPPGKRDLYAPLFEEYMELRPGVEIRAYVKVDLWNAYHSLEGAR